MIEVKDKEALQRYVGVLFGMLEGYPNALTVEQLCEALNMGEKQVRARIKDGSLQSIWVGNGYRVLKHEVVLWLAMMQLDTQKLEENVYGIEGDDADDEY